MKKPMRIIQLALGIIFSPALFAAGGLIEINQVCATQLGCFSGDTSGYPVTITGAAGSSYILTSDLVLASNGTSGINITANGISIDLNGFSIISQACLDTNDNTCTPGSGAGIGISIQTASYHEASVKNGKVIGMGSSGVSLTGSRSRIENVTVQWNRSNGILVGPDSWVNNSVAFENGGPGIRFSNGANIKNNIARGNGGSGLRGSSYAVIENNIAVDNGNDGIAALGVASVINANTANNNDGDGIQCTADCLVTNNVVTLNVDRGLNIFTRVAYSGNVIFNNGSTVNGGINMGGNLCGVAVCP